MLNGRLNTVSSCMYHHSSVLPTLRGFSCIMISAVLVPKLFAAASLGSSTHFRAQQLYS